ncbi:hypothetical protein B0H11DRAFT_859648 [Mycena galericulata]|nr:hypothetical protein B0H11DRAFT_859648 [Mycena galericulata]
MIATLHNRVEHPSTRELKSTNLTPGCSRRRPSTCATFARRRPGTSDVHARAVRCSAVVVRMPPAGVRRRDVKMRVHPQRAHEPRSGPDDVHARVVGTLAAGVRAVQGKYEAHAAHDPRPGPGDVYTLEVWELAAGVRCTVNTRCTPRMIPAPATETSMRAWWGRGAGIRAVSVGAWARRRRGMRECGRANVAPGTRRCVGALSVRCRGLLRAWVRCDVKLRVHVHAVHEPRLGPATSMRAWRGGVAVRIPPRAWVRSAVKMGYRDVRTIPAPTPAPSISALCSAGLGATRGGVRVHPPPARAPRSPCARRAVWCGTGACCRRACDARRRRRRWEMRKMKECTCRGCCSRHADDVWAGEGDCYGCAGAGFGVREGDRGLCAAPSLSSGSRRIDGWLRRKRRASQGDGQMRGSAMRVLARETRCQPSCRVYPHAGT